MIKRRLQPVLEKRIGEAPAVVLLGPRQAGKTTLAHTLAKRLSTVYLDLESEADRVKLSEPELYLSGLFDHLVILDEIHRVPGLFRVLRGLIDRARRSGKRHGLYLLLDSASIDLLRQSGETLAGRVSYLDLGPFDILETGPTLSERERLWVRGGFPESILASTDDASLRWRRDFIRAYLERDISQLGPRIDAETLRRFWTMLAHLQGSPLNVAQLARNIGVDTRTAASYLDLLVDLLLVRRLSPWQANIGKRIAKSPKIYIRDSGVLHALLGIGDRDALLSHPVVGMSWEGFIIENLLTIAPEGTEGFYYRTSGGAEIDLVLSFPDKRRWAIEIKRSLAPRPEKGFHFACEDLRPDRKFIVYPGDEGFPLGAGIQAVPFAEMASLVSNGG